MLGVSLRLSEQIDFITPINRYIESNYNSSEYQQVQHSVSDINNQRKLIIQSIGRQDSNHQGIIDICSNYYAALCTLQLHFPFGIDAINNITSNRPYNTIQQQQNKNTVPHTGGLLSKLSFTNRDSTAHSTTSRSPQSQSNTSSPLQPQQKVNSIRVQFLWCDAFKPSNRVADFDIQFEKSSILFNIGAMYSRYATYTKSQSTTQSTDYLKSSSQLFQQSAGIFYYMSQNIDVMTCSRLSIDLTPECLSMLCKLMLAQSQATLFELSTAKVSTALISKIASGTAELYRHAYDICNKSQLKQLFNAKDVYNWEAHCYYQLMCYTATANYWYAKCVFESDQYGLEIAHLQRALLYIKNACKVENVLVGNLAENRQRLESQIMNRLNNAIKDNESIYYEKIPDCNAIKDPDSVITAKIVPYEPKLSMSTDPFINLITPAIRDASNTFTNKLQSFVNTYVAQAQSSTQSAQSIVTQLGLPGSLDALDNNTGLNNELWQQISDIQHSGGMNTLHELCDSIQSGVTDCNKLFQQAKAILEKEAAEDSAMKQQFTHRWNRRSSQQLTTPVYNDIEVIDKFMIQAKQSDTKLINELHSNENKLNILSQSRQQIENQLPHNTEQSNKSELSDTLRNKYNELMKLIDSRNVIVAQLQELPGKIDITNTLLHQHKTSSYDDIYTSELNKQQHYIDQLYTLQQQQDSLLNDIQTQNQLFVASQKQNESLIQRQSILQHISTAIQTYNKLLQHLHEGQKFYNDLMTAKIKPLKERIDDYVFARNMEKKMLLEQLTANITGYNTVNNNDINSVNSQNTAINPNLSLEAPTGNYATITSIQSSNVPQTAPLSTSTPPPYSRADKPNTNNSINNSNHNTSTNPFDTQTTYQPPQYSQSYKPSVLPPANQQYQQPTNNNTNSNKNEKSCPQCTYINGILDTQCVMCGANI